MAVLERTHGVRILYACESGSRAWGFASPDSDYDARFIYVQERDNYLSIRDRKDVLERPVDAVLDIGGWDVRKALQLFLKTNSTLYEWLQSPIVYKEEGDLARTLRGWMDRYYSRRAGCHHYFSMARNVFEQELQGERVKLKKYFYVLRPLLACSWIAQKGEVPPMEFGILRTQVADAGWQATVDDLLAQKAVSDEKRLIEPVGLLQEWIGENLALVKDAGDAIAAVSHDPGELDILFRKTIGS